MIRNQHRINSRYLDELSWLSNEIFTAFPQEVSALKFYVLDCECIYYKRIFEDGSLDPQIGIYRYSENGPCEMCMAEGESWRERVVDEAMIFKKQAFIGQ